MGTAQVIFAVVLCGGATASHVTGSDISHVPCPDVCAAHAQPEVAQYPPYWGLLTGSDKITCPEVALTGSMFCACPAFPAFFSS